MDLQSKLSTIFPGSSTILSASEFLFSRSSRVSSKPAILPTCPPRSANELEI